MRGLERRAAIEIVAVRRQRSLGFAQRRQHGAVEARERGLRLGLGPRDLRARGTRSDDHTSELQSLMRNTYAVFCLYKKKLDTQPTTHKPSLYAIHKMSERNYD